MHKMLVDDVNCYDLNLEKIDEEIRMERIRQNSRKLTWDGFSNAVRRNLLEKRIGFDAEGRLDVLHAITIMRKNMPVDENQEILQRLLQLSDSLECSMIEYETGVAIKNADVTIEVGVKDNEVFACKISYWDDQLMDSPDGEELLKKGDFAQVRRCIYDVLAIIPSNAGCTDKLACKEALRAMEQHLMAYANESSFDAINAAPYGFFCPRTSLRPGRLYFVAEPPFIRSVANTHAGITELENLPYIEVSFTSNDRECQLPLFNPSGKWTEFRAAHACVCIRFSHAMVFSKAAQRSLDRFMAKSPLIRHYSNIYRFMGGRENLMKNMVMRTRFPKGTLQHRYDVDVGCLASQNDPVLVEMYISDLRQLREVVAIIRSQWMHNSLWESILSMTFDQRQAVESLRIMCVPSRTCFELAFPARDKLLKVQIQEVDNCKWSVAVTTYDGASVDADLDKRMTETLMTTWSIPVTLSLAVRELGCTASPDTDLVDESPTKTHDLTSKTRVITTDKVGSAWLHSPSGASRPLNNNRTNDEPSTSYSSEEVACCGLLASVKDVDVEFALPAPARLEQRAKRLQSDNPGFVFSDLQRHDAQTPTRLLIGRIQERIRQLAETVDDDGAASVGGASRMSLDSPAVRPNSITQLSPLESARLKMAQSMSAAAAVGMASCAPTPTSNASGGIGMGPDIFDFPAERSPSSGFSTPSPHFGQYMHPQYPQVPSQPPTPQSGRGAPKTRRPRVRKTANMGDRVSTDSSLGMPPQTPTRGRGSGRRGRTPGSRKAAGATHMDYMTQPQQPGEQRPQLQRSFSDYPPQFNSFPPTPQQQTMASPATYTEEDSDEECDPPPPPKPIGYPPSSSGRSAHPSASPMQSPGFGPLGYSPSTPSPLTYQRTDKQDVMQETADTQESTPLDHPKPPLLVWPGVSTSYMNTTTTANYATTSMTYTSNMASTSVETPGVVYPTQQQPQKQQPQQQQQQQLQQQVQNSRKTSLESAITKIKNNQPQPKKNKKAFKDLYDDGTSKSPSPPEKKMPMSAATAQQPSSSSIVSPKLSPKDPSSSNDGVDVKLEPPSQMAGPSKLTVKMSKTSSSRNSPSVDVQKAKSVAMAMPKLEKEVPEKRERTEKEKERARVRKERRQLNKEKERENKPVKPPSEAKKRKMEPGKTKEKEREYPGPDKKMKLSNKAGPSSPSVGKLSSAAPPLINPANMMASLKNFKIPKKETVEETREREREKEPPPVKEKDVKKDSPAIAPMQPPLPPPVQPPMPVQLPPPIVGPLAADFQPGNFGAFAGPVLTPTSKVKKGPPLHINIPGRGGMRKPDHIRGGDNRRGAGMFPHRGVPYNHGFGQPKVASYAQGIPPHMGPPQPITPSGIGGQWVRPPSIQQGHRSDPPQKPPEPPKKEEPKKGRTKDDPGSPEDSLRIADD